MESRSSAVKMRTIAYQPVVEVSGHNAYNKLQAKQRASIQWLLSKSYGQQQVPDDAREPFYRDVEDQEYLKPSLVHALANAELYCLALAHIYADPNYSQLNHWGVIQALARKGVYVAEPSDVALTETTLIHTSPLRMSAHMAVMEAIMNLFVKEVASAERIVSAVRRFSDPTDPLVATSLQQTPKDAEQALLLWISMSCQALKKRLAAEAEANGESVPNFPELRELSDLGDGVNLLGLLAFYCPELVDWTRIACNEPFSMADCIYNLEMVHKFCSESLPSNVFHLALEDLVYMHSSVRQNVLAFLTDLFYWLELRPAKCVRPPGLMRGTRFPVSTEGGNKSNVSIRRQGSLQEHHRSSNDRTTPASAGSTPTGGNKRLTVHEVFGSNWQPTAGGSPSSSSTFRRSRFEPADDSNVSVNADQESFVVHRGKTVPTLNNVAVNANSSGDSGVSAGTPSRSRVAAIKERFNVDTKADERGESAGNGGGNGSSGSPAGVPSNWEDRKVSTYSGRRSRRNSITSDDSHLTIENFGGSQDNLSMFGRNPDKEPVTLSGRRPSIDMIAGATTPLTSDAMSAAGTPSNWRRSNNERNRSQENLSDYLIDNRDIEEQLETLRRSRASSPTYSSISSTAKSGSNGGGGSSKPFVIIAGGGGGDSGDLYDDSTRLQLAKATNFAELSRLRETLGSNSAINIVYMQQDRGDSGKGSGGVSPPVTHHRRTSEHRKSAGVGGGITIAEATSWEPQTPIVDSSSTTGDVHQTGAGDLYSIRLKMEEKRKRIEAEKRQMELMANQQRAKVGKAAFLQAVAKGKGDNPNAMMMPDYSPGPMDSPARSHQQPDDLPADYDYPQQPMHGMPYDPYQRLQQQQQHQPTNGNGHHSAAGQQQQFYLHDPSPTSRRTWGQPQPVLSPTSPSMTYRPEDLSGYGMQQPQQRRAQWGTPQPVRTMMSGHHGYMAPIGTPGGPGSYMDPHGQAPGGYMMSPNTPSHHPGNHPYSEAHYYANGSPYQDVGPPPQQQQHHHQQQQMPDPYGQYHYNQPRQAYPYGQPQPQPGYGMAHHPPPAASPQHQHQQQHQPNYPMQPAQSYPSAADQRAPFRLHPSSESESVAASRSPAPASATKQQHTESVMEQHRGSVQQTSSSSSRPVAAARTITPQRSNGLSSSVGSPPNSGSVMHTAIPTPSIDDMEPQNVSFIDTSATVDGGADETDLQLPRRLRNLNITSGNRTYRIPHEAQSSPPRPALTKTFHTSPSPTRGLSSPSPTSSPAGHFQHYQRHQQRQGATSSPSDSSTDDATLDEGVKTAKLKENVEADRGFIITFDDDVTGPKRPKPLLGAKRLQSPTKKSSTYSAPSEIVQSTNNHRQPLASQPPTHSAGTYSRTESREGSPRRSLSSFARENRDDYSPFAGDSRDSGFGHNSQEELKLFNMATAPLGGNRSALGYDSQDDDNGGPPTAGLLIGDELVNPDPETLDEMERKKEKILMQSMRRKQQQEELRQRKELEAQQRKEEERFKEEEKQRKKEEEKARRAVIFEQYKIKKAMEEAEKEGRVFEMPDHMGGGKSAGPKMRSRNNNNAGTTTRPRPKTIHIDAGTDFGGGSGASTGPGSSRTMTSSKGKRGSSNNLSESRAEGARGSNTTLNRRGSNSSLHGESQTPSRYRTIERGGHSGKKKDLSVPRFAQSGGSTRSSREDLYSSRGYRGSNSSLNDADSYEAYHTPLVHTGRKGSGFMTGGRQADATVMAATAAAARSVRGVNGTSIMRRSGSLMDFSGPGSLPPGLVTKRRGFDDGASDVSSNQEYIGPRLYKQPAARSNRSIILNAVEYCVFPGVVNREAKQRVLEEITRSESKNFLVLFRDAGCQFRALYSYCPESEEIIKLYGTGPKVVNDTMFEKFFKYNSGGKCFSQVHTKHLTVTIDAFTIHAGLWQGKKTSLPNKKDMTLVI